MGNHTRQMSYLDKVKDNWTKRKQLNTVVATILALLVLLTLLAAVQAQQANAWTANDHCDGSPQFHKTRYLGDKRHEPLRLAEFNMRASACYNHHGWIKKANAKVYLHSNSTAASLGYRYELDPGANATHVYRHAGHIQAVMFKRAGTYRQCVPGLPSSPATCGPSGDFHVEITVFARYAVKHSPYVNHTFTWLHFEDTWYSQQFMNWYVNRNW